MTATPPPSGEQAYVQVFGPAKNSDQARRYGLLAERYQVSPATVATGRGAVAIRDAWLEKRPHPDVKAKLAAKHPEHAREFYLLCLLTDAAASPFAAIEEGQWFTGNTEWMSTSTANVRIMQLRLEAPPGDTIELNVIALTDLQLEGRTVVVPPNRGRRQTLTLTRKSFDAATPDHGATGH